MSTTALKTTEFSVKRKVLLQVKRNLAKSKKPIFINTLTPYFEFINDKNEIVKPNTLLKI